METAYDPLRGNFNSLFATASALFNSFDDGSGYPALKGPQGKPFVVKDIFTDFKRHDLGPHFYERNYDGTLQRLFLTRPLWGVGSTGPYGHDGRSMSLDDVILRHGGESQASAQCLCETGRSGIGCVQKFLNSLILFSPDDTASNLDPGDRSTPYFPQFGHGSIKLSVLFNDPGDPEYVRPCYRLAVWSRQQRTVTRKLTAGSWHYQKGRAEVTRACLGDDSIFSRR